MSGMTGADYSSYDAEPVFVYHSIWQNLLLIVVCVPMILGSYSMIWSGTAGMIIGIAGVIFFGLGALVIAWFMLSERLCGKPYLQIFGDGIVVREKTPRRIMFADVKEFALASEKGKGGKFSDEAMLNVIYKDDVEARKYMESSKMGRILRRFNTKLGGAAEGISVDGLTMKKKDLCALLQQRLESYNSRNAE